MNHLLEQLDTLASRLRQLAYSWAIAWTAVVVLSAALTVELVDYLVRWESAASRWAALTGVLILGLCVLTPYVSWLLFRKISRLEIALRLERLQPSWRGELAALASLNQEATSSDSRLPMKSSLEAVVNSLRERGLLNASLLTLEQSLDARRLRVPYALLALLACVVLGGFVLRPEESLIAADRLFRPWSDTRWPKSTILEVLNQDFEPIDPDRPLKVVAHRPLQIYIRDKQGFPPAELHVSLHEGTTRRKETLAPAKVILADGTSEQAFSLILFPDQRQMYFRASAEDDQEMSWYTVIGTAPPKFVSATTTISPPEYLNQPATTVEGIPVRLTGLPGTRLTIQAVADRQLSDAQLQVSGLPLQSVKLDQSGRRLSAEVPIEAAGRTEYQFRLVDLDGLTEPQGPAYEFLASEDRLPQISIDTPGTDQKVTSRITFPVRISASDDQGLSGISVSLTSENGQISREILSRTLHSSSSTSFQEEILVDFSTLKLMEGDRIILRASAGDFAPGENRIQWATHRRLTVVSEEELKRDLASRQAALADTLSDLFKRESQIAQLVRQLEIQQRQTGFLRPEDLEGLAALQDKQLAIFKFTDPHERSLAHDASTILRDYEQNQVDEKSAEILLRAMVEELARLRSGSLGRSQELLDKSVSSLSSRDPSTKGAVEAGQAEVIGELAFELGQVVESLGQLTAQSEIWRRNHDLADDLSRILLDFASLHSDTISTGQRTLASSISSLLPQDRAELAKLAERQIDIGKHVRKLGDELKQASSSQSNLQPAVQHLEDRQISSRLIQAAEQLERNNIGEAVTVQSRVAGDLQTLENLVKGSTITTAETLLKKVEEAQSSVQTFRVRQSVLERMWRETERMSASEEYRETIVSITEQQKELVQEISRLAKDLRFAGLESPASLSDEAARKLHQVQELLNSGRASRAEIDVEQKHFDQLLEQLDEDLQRTRKQLELESAADNLWNLATVAEALAGRERSLAEEITRLEGNRKSRGRLTRAELSTVQQTAVNQDSLADEVNTLNSTLEPASFLHAVLDEVAAEMQEIADSIRQRDTSSDVSDRQSAAAERLMLFSQAIRESMHSQSSGNTSSGENSTAESASGEPQSLAVVAELRLLLIEQERILFKTKELLSQDSVSEADQEQVRELGARQQRLTDWFAKLLSREQTSAN